MTILFFADIRDLTQEKELHWGKPAATLHDLLNDLATRYGQRFRQRVYDDDKLNDAIIVLINGCDARHQGNLDAHLGPDDTVCVFPMVAGG